MVLSCLGAPNSTLRGGFVSPALNTHPGSVAGRSKPAPGDRAAVMDGSRARQIWGRRDKTGSAVGWPDHCRVSLGEPPSPLRVMWWKLAGFGARAGLESDAVGAKEGASLSVPSGNWSNTVVSHLNTCIDRGRARGRACWGPACPGTAPRGDSGWAGNPGCLPGLRFPCEELGSSLEGGSWMVRGGVCRVLA